LSRVGIYIIGMMIIIMGFTYLTAQFEGSTKLIVIGDIFLLIAGILGVILIRNRESEK
jgi:hypothetical protein